MKIYQHIDEFNPYDGMGNDCRGFRQLFDSMGLENYILTRTNRSDQERTLSTEDAIPGNSKDVHILHFGGSGYPLSGFLKRKGRKILRFHNMTPPHYFQGGNPGVFLAMDKFFKKSILELNSMEKIVDFSFSVSGYNSHTLSQYSNIPSIVFPIVRDYKIPIQRIFKPRETLRLTFIGRIVPNKKWEEVLKIVFFLKKIYPSVQLDLIGSPVSGIRDYYEFILTAVENLNLEDVVIFHHNMQEEEKERILRKSDFFLCMSDHEGFGIPLIEAMEAGLPVIAKNSSAVEETLKSGGLLLEKEDPLRIAELLYYLKDNFYLINRILRSQDKAMEFYKNFPFRRILKDHLMQKENSFSITGSSEH